MRPSRWAEARAAVRDGAGYAQTKVDREVKATREREVRVGVNTSMRADCTAVRCPRSACPLRANIAAVTVRRATLKATNLKQCLATELPALVAFYRPKTDFANDDRFELGNELRPGRRLIQRLHVTILNGANETQRI